MSTKRVKLWRFSLKKIRLLRFKVTLFKVPEAPISIVTAADDSHFRSSVQLLQSIQRHEPSVEIFYFNLGLRESYVEQLNQDFPLVKVITFEYRDYPNFFNIRVEAGQYAWKPACIRRALELSNENLVWLDAGDLVTSSLKYIKKLIKRDGIFIMQTSNTVGELTHPSTIAYFQAERHLPRLQLSAAIVGFSREDISAVNCLNKWQELSSIRRVIAPAHSSRLNHRQDQAVLTLVLFQEPKLDERISKFLSEGLENRVLGVLTHQDLEKSQ